MVKVTIDVAGMYYGRDDVEIPEGSTVRAALQAAHDLDYADRLKGGRKPLISFSSDHRAPAFLRSITVHHLDRAVSRQDSTRTYEAGEYTFRSDGVENVAGAGFRAVDFNGVPTGRPFVQTWQYYVYDAAGVDLSRQAAGAETRKVVPFSVVDPEGSNKLVDHGQIVFRLVTIFLMPTRTSGIKSDKSVIASSHYTSQY